MKQPSSTPLFAAIEAGGTKFDLAIGTADGQVLHRHRIVTQDPAGTISAIVAQFKSWFSQGFSCQALGIGSFGPLDLEARSPTWGHITKTPKPGWAMTNLAPAVSAALNLPCAIDTDVNSAALYESRFGSAQNLDCVVYFTIGTGIGGGAVVQGQLLHGLVHPEMGHIYLKRHPQDQFVGHCPFHGDCAEGLASGPALAARWGRPSEELGPDHPAWEIEAWYIAQLAVNAQMMLSPQAIVLGGGVMEVAGMLDKIRRQAQVLAASYLAKPQSAQDWADLIRLPRVENPGLRGALVLAADLYAAL